MIKARARELGLINGHGSSKPTETDYQQAKRELTGDEGKLRDAGLIKKSAESLRAPVPALCVAEKNLKWAVALSFGQENASALTKTPEKETGVDVKACSVNE